MQHRRDWHELQARKGAKWIFHRAIAKWGVDAFDWTVLYDNLDKEDLDVYEMACIRKHCTKVPHGYNMTDGGGSKLGYNCPQETRHRISVANKGRKRTDETKQKIRDAVLGNKRKPFTAETIQLMRDVHTGKKHSDKTKRKISAFSRGLSFAELHGVDKAAEITVKLSKAHKGRKKSDATKAKMSEWQKGKSLSEEHRAKLSTVKKGRPWSEARRRAFSEKQATNVVGAIHVQP